MGFVLPHFHYGTRVERALEGSGGEGLAVIPLKQITDGQQTSGIGIASQRIHAPDERQPPAKLVSAETLTNPCHCASAFVLQREQKG